MIKGKCRTNLDDYNCSKVSVFASIPNKGDNVVVHYKGRLATLRVCSITHDYDREDDQPFIIVELHN